MPRNNEVTDVKLVDFEDNTEVRRMRNSQPRQLDLKPSSRSKITLPPSAAQQGPKRPDPISIEDEKTALIVRVNQLKLMYSELSAQMTIAIAHPDFSRLRIQHDRWEINLDNIALDKKKLKSDVKTFNKQLAIAQQIVAVGTFFTDARISLQPLEILATKCDQQLSTLNILYICHLKYLARQPQDQQRSDNSCSKFSCLVM